MGDFLKGGLEQFADLREGADKKEGLVFLRGVETTMHTTSRVNLSA